MVSDPTRLFSASDLDRISAAVQAAERTVSGEIVPYVVARSDHYPESPWRAAAILGGLALAIAGSIPLIFPLWPSIGITMTAAAGLGSGFIGWLLGDYVPPIRRLLAGRGTMLRRAAGRAAEAFVSEEVFATRDRTGILIFISVFERKVIVLGDSGIHARIEGSEWNDLVTITVEGIRSGKPTDGLIHAIESCGQLLLSHGFSPSPENANELPDSLRFGREEGSP